MTVITWLDVVDALEEAFGASVPSPQARAEAWRFTARLAGKRGAYLPAGATERIPRTLWETMALAIRRVAAGEPEAYVLGSVPFHDVDVEVDPGALIPRQETEILVDAVIESCRRARWQAPLILDLGTGTGCIALALAEALPAARITATDIWPPALRTAARNLCGGIGAGRVHLVCADWLTWTTARWNVIVGNPPYVAAEVLAGLDASVRDWEPQIALDGGPGGLLHLHAIIAQAPRHLHPGGILALELSPEQGEQAMECAQVYGFETAEIIDDLAGRRRVIRATAGG